MSNNGSTIVPPNSTGNPIDCSSLSVGGVVSYRQRIVLADNARSANFAVVSSGSLQVLVQNNVVLGAGANNIGTVNNISAAVSLAAGSNNIGTINNISAAVALAAGSANIGSINNISAAVALAAGTANIGAVSLAAGTSNIGSINNISAAVQLAAGAANIGSINNISAAVTVVGNIVGGTTSATAGSSFVLVGGTDGSLARVLKTDANGNVVVNNISAAVVLAAGSANIGSINNISAAVVLAAGAANIGSINNISANVNVVLQAGSNNIGTINNISAAVVLGAGAANIGLINNISASVNVAMGYCKTSASTTVADKTVTSPWIDKNRRLVTVLNHPSLPPSASHGPKTVTISTSAVIALVAAPGAGNQVYIASILATNGSNTLTSLQIMEASATATPVIDQYLAASGGGINPKFDPPWRVSANTALNMRIKPSVSKVKVTVHFYVGVD